MKNRQPLSRLEKDGAFVFRDYNLARPWASFFPGIAGLFGIPLWVFYVNRGQCIASVGIRSKDEALMEFLPANKAYQLTPAQGFRTFIKVKQTRQDAYYEPFCVANSVSRPWIKNRMVVRPFDLQIVEDNPALGLRVEVSYFSLPGAPFAALVRELAIENTSRKSLEIEFLDGLSILVPYGVNNFFLKEMSRTIEAWMTVTGAAEGIPLYKVTTDPRDASQVAFVKGAHFYTGFSEGAAAGSMKVIVDPAAIFGNISDFSFPEAFVKKRPSAFGIRRTAGNKMPCAFSYVKTNVSPGGRKRFFSMIGHVFDEADIKRLGIRRIDEDFVAAKRRENQALIEGIMDQMSTSSGMEAFDLYSRQTYLDNVLRGGLPYSFSLDGRRKSVYVFSRKHGDLERDYNRFLLSPTYFSQGEGNYRDVNQNRRSDVFFNPFVAEKNIVDFMDLVQLDGYNPLVFKGEMFTVSTQEFRQGGLVHRFREKDAEKIARILSKPFAVGDVLRYIEENKIFLSGSREEFVKELLAAACAGAEAVFGDGYWSDHWTYNTDLLESFKAVYPDGLKEILFQKDDFTYFDTHVFVKPRAERYTAQQGGVRQRHSLGTDEEKKGLISRRHEERNKVRIHNGEGPVFSTTLVAKFLGLIVVKLATLDPYGTGVEMEADKPDWYDALNGLPGSFGSSISETFELKRLILLLLRFSGECKIPDTHEVALAAEVFDFWQEMLTLLKGPSSDFDFWDRSNSLKESFRLKVRRGVSGDLKKVSFGEIREFFDRALDKLNAGISKSYDPKTGFYHTYFAYEVVRHESLPQPCGEDPIAAKEFKQRKLPLFLEGFVHALRTEDAKAKKICRAVKKSPLWDAKLKMYKVNASLEKESFEIGRARAFTPGWLENGSIWLHMEYKYLLELLKNRLYDDFYEDFFNVLVPFQDPRTYGRSTLENSSFIVSSAHPDASLHGAGFVARLSGSTAEFIHMWLLMNAGPEPFFLDEAGKLSLRFRPALSSAFFTKKGTYRFTFLGKTLVTYLNPGRKNTFGRHGVRPVHYRLFDKRGEIVPQKGGVLGAPYAELVRTGKIDRIDVLLGKI